MQSLMAQGMILTLILVEINNHIIRRENPWTDPQAYGRRDKLMSLPSTFSGLHHKSWLWQLWDLLSKPWPQRYFISEFLLSKPLRHSSTSYYKLCRCWFQAKGSNNTKNRVWHLLVVQSWGYGAVYNPQVMRVVSKSFRVLPQVFPVINRVNGIRRSVLRLICLMLTFPFLARVRSAKSASVFQSKQEVGSHGPLYLSLLWRRSINQLQTYKMISHKTQFSEAQNVAQWKGWLLAGVMCKI